LTAAFYSNVTETIAN